MNSLRLGYFKKMKVAVVAPAIRFIMAVKAMPGRSPSGHLVRRKTVSYLGRHEPTNPPALRVLQGFGQEPDRDPARGAPAARPQARRHAALSRDRRRRAAGQGARE